VSAPGPVRHIIGTGDLIEERDLVEFRLIYTGELLGSGGNNTRSAEKHAIRRSLHPQLRRLWEMNDNLRGLAVIHGNHARTEINPKEVPSEQSQFEFGLNAIGNKWQRADFRFIPLVTTDMVLRCSLDILLLRPEDQRFIFRQGDVDGQLKTLFDALKIPANLGETGGIGPQQDEEPFFCLLEDDRLISEVRVNTDQLLLLPDHRELKANDAHVIIHVKLNHKHPRTFDNYFG
jgi:hypothetical protein